jgi:hypothetical protein
VDLAFVSRGDGCIGIVFILWFEMLIRAQRNNVLGEALCARETACEPRERLATICNGDHAMDESQPALFSRAGSRSVAQSEVGKRIRTAELMQVIISIVVLASALYVILLARDARRQCAIGPAERSWGFGSDAWENIVLVAHRAASANTLPKIAKRTTSSDVVRFDFEFVVERRRIELPTFALRTRRSPS